MHGTGGHDRRNGGSECSEVKTYSALAQKVFFSQTLIDYTKPIRKNKTKINYLRTI
jgi:hypothetical protein